MSGPNGARPERLANQAPSATENEPIVADTGQSHEPLLLDVLGVADMFHVTPEFVRKLDRTKSIPAPRPLDSRALWLRIELEDWSAAGYPTRKHWAQAGGRG